MIVSVQALADAHAESHASAYMYKCSLRRAGQMPRNMCACVNLVYVWEAGTHMSMHVDVQRWKRTCPETCISTWEEQRKGGENQQLHS